MNIYFYTNGTGRIYETDLLDAALCELCGTCLCSDQEVCAGLCDSCADRLLYEPTEQGKAFIAEGKAAA